MPQSLVQNLVHITFSTKDRYPFITESIQEELFKYLGGTCRDIECKPFIVGGVEDHVHLLVDLSRKVALMTLVERLKTGSSKWIKTKSSEFNQFYWQQGYGGFSVNSQQIDIVTDYIRNQKKHHQSKSYKDEYRAFLKKYNIQFDERYVWD